MSWLRKHETDHQRNLARREAQLRKRDEVRKTVKLTAEERARERKRQERKRDYTGHAHGYQVTKAHIDKEFVAARLAALPKDTRNITQALCGDPLPGRSALDRTRSVKCCR